MCSDRKRELGGLQPVCLQVLVKKEMREQAYSNLDLLENILNIMLSFFLSFKIIKIYFPRWHDGYGEILSCGKSAGVSIKISFSPMNKTDIFQNAPVSQFKCRNLYLKLIVKYIL